MDLVFEKYGDARSIVPEFIFKVSREHWNKYDITEDAIIKFYKHKRYTQYPIHYNLHVSVEAAFNNGKVLPKISYEVGNIDDNKVVYSGHEIIDIDDDGICI